MSEAGRKAGMPSEREGGREREWEGERKARRERDRGVVV